MGRGTVRRMVEGAYHLRSDIRKGAFQIFHYVTCDQPQDAIAAFGHVAVAGHVPAGPIAKIVAGAIHLNNDSGRGNVKIRRVRTDWMLPENLESKLLAAKLAPEQNFRRTQALAQLA